MAVEPGRRYRLTVTLNTDGPGGKQLVPVVIHTDSVAHPVVRILVATLLRERVYTFPDAVDLGAIPLTQWKSGNPSLAQTLMVYQSGGTAFEATFSTDLPGVTIEAQRGPLKDRWQATLAIDPAAARTGPLRGSITIRTNDPEFPVLTVPVSGAVLADETTRPPDF